LEEGRSAAGTRLKQLILLAGSALWGLALPAQAPPPLPEALQVLTEQVLQHNPGLQAQRARVAAAARTPSQAYALPDPTADAEFMNLSVNHPDLSGTLTKSVSVGITQTFPYPGKRALLKERAEREAAVEAAKLAAMESDLRGRAIGAAYGLALAQRLLDLNGQTQDTLAAAAKSAEGLYAAGLGRQADLLLAQTALTRAQADRQELLQRRQVAVDELERLAGGPVDSDGLAALPLPEPSPLPAFESLTAALAQGAPSVLAAKALEPAGESEAALARKNFKPDFVVGARYRHNDMSMGGGDFLTATFGLTLPFFHRKNRYQPALQEALDLLESARMETQDARVEARYDLAEAYQQALRDQRVYQLDQGGLLIQARQAYESSLAGYAVGKVDFSTLLTALTNLYAYQAETLSAQAGYQRARARMEAVAGHPLPAPPPEAEPNTANEEGPK
jgi:cobalt-zinc-cadmium efflux system outer membrane protein